MPSIILDYRINRDLRLIEDHTPASVPLVADARAILKSKNILLLTCRARIPINNLTCWILAELRATRVRLLYQNPMVRRLLRLGEEHVIVLLLLIAALGLILPELIRDVIRMNVLLAFHFQLVTHVFARLLQRGGNL